MQTKGGSGLLFWWKNRGAGLLGPALYGLGPVRAGPRAGPYFRPVSKFYFKKKLHMILYLIYDFFFFFYTCLKDN